MDLYELVRAIIKAIKELLFPWTRFTGEPDLSHME